MDCQHDYLYEMRVNRPDGHLTKVFFCCFKCNEIIEIDAYNTTFENCQKIMELDKKAIDKSLSWTVSEEDYSDLSEEQMQEVHNLVLSMTNGMKDYWIKKGKLPKDL